MDRPEQSRGSPLSHDAELALELIKRASDSSSRALERINAIEALSKDAREKLAEHGREIRQSSERLGHLERTEKELRAELADAKKMISRSLEALRSAVDGDLDEFRAILNVAESEKSERRRAFIRSATEIIVGLLALIGAIGAAILPVYFLSRGNR